MGKIKRAKIFIKIHIIMYDFHNQNIYILITICLITKLTNLNN